MCKLTSIFPLILVVLLSAPLTAQVPDPATSSSPTPSPSPTASISNDQTSPTEYDEDLKELQRLQEVTAKVLAITPLRRMASVLGRPKLFPLAGTPKISAAERRESLEIRLMRVKKRQGSQSQLVVIDESFGPLVLRADKTVLVTLLEEDLPRYFSSEMTPAAKRRVHYAVARKWRAILQEELDLAATMHTGAYYRFAASLTVVLLLLGLGCSYVLDKIGQRYFKHPLWSQKLLIWTLIIMMIFCLFAESQSLGLWVSRHVFRPLLLLWLLVTVGSLCELLIRRFLRSQLYTLLSYQQEVDDGRLALRLKTYASAASLVIRAVLILVGGAIYLHLLGFETTSSLASMSAFGVLAGYITQDTIKNATTGILVLAEDRYGLGDWVEAGTFKGEVEAFSLFTTQLRDLEGSLVTIPNSKMEPVRNSSKLWSQMDYRVQVSYQTDLDKALGLLLEETRKLALENELPSPEKYGVEELGDNGVTLRVLLRTGPAQHFALGRELNLRVKKLFDAEGIEIPFPQLKVWNASEGSTDPKADSNP